VPLVIEIKLCRQTVQMNPSMLLKEELVFRVSWLRLERREGTFVQVGRIGRIPTSSNQVMKEASVVGKGVIRQTKRQG